MTNETWQILDARAVTYHCYNSGIDPDGDGKASDGTKLHTPGHTIENFIKMYLLPLADTTRLGKWVVCWDKGKEYRKRMFPGYKAQRKEKLPEVQAAYNASFDAMKRLFTYLGVVQCAVDGVEADDVIAHLVEHLPGFKFVHTTDADLYQLCSDNTQVWLKGEPNGDAWAHDGLVIPFNRVALYKSICGDASDNYPGVKGVGPKAWQKLIDDFGPDVLQALQDAVSNADFSALADDPHPVVRKLFEARSEWRTAWDLARLHGELADTFYDGKFQRPIWHARLPSREKMERLLAQTNCTHLLPDLEHLLPTRWLLTGEVTSSDVQEMKNLFKQSPFIAIDFESYDTLQHDWSKGVAKGKDYVDVLSQSITGVGVTFGRNSELTMYVSINHADTDNVSREFLIDLLDAIPDGTPVVAHNAFGFERTVFLREFGFDIPNLHCTKAMSSYVDENLDAGLKSLSKHWLNYEQATYGNVIEQGKTMRDYSAEHVFSYGADDPFVTATLYRLFYLILNIEGTWGFVKNEEFAAGYLLSDAFMSGVEIDAEEMERQKAEDQETLDASILKLRQLLAKNQTDESIEAGVENFLPEFRIGRDGTEEELRADLRARITYKPLVVEEQVIEFKPTPVQLSKVSTHLSLPAIEKATKKYLTEYLTAYGDNEFGRLLGNAVPHLKTQDGPEYAALEAFCLSVLAKLRPEGKGLVTTGTELNLGSPVQNQVLLYGMLGLPMKIRNFEVSDARARLGCTEGTVQTNEDAINEALANDVVDGDWRKDALLALHTAKKCMTRISGFYNKWPNFRHPATGVVHPGVNPTGTETRRPSSSNPNLLNLPKRGEGIKIRRAILPNKRLGHDCVVSIDFSQEELREMAGLSLDYNLLDCYIGKEVAHCLPPWTRDMLGDAVVEALLQSSTKDVHAMTACTMAHMPYDEFEAARKDESNPEHTRLNGLRKDAKAPNFLSQYGGGAPKLARKMVKPLAVAQAFLDGHRATYPGTYAWKETVVQELAVQGYVTTLYGNRRHFYNQYLTSDSGMKGHIERQAINYKIQGLAADILKRTLAELWRRQTLQKYSAAFVASVYDECVFTCHHSVAAPLILEVQSVMTRHIEGLPVPFLAEASIGHNFAAQVELGAFPALESIRNTVDEMFPVEVLEAA